MVEGGGFTAGIRGFFCRMAQLLSLGKGGTRAERPEIRRVEMPIETNGSNATQRNGGSVDEANVSVTLEEIKNRGKLLREKLHERFGTASSRSENSLTAENDRTEDRVHGSSLIAVVKLALFVSLVRLMVLFEVGVRPPHHGVGKAQSTNVVFAVT